MGLFEKILNGLLKNGEKQTRHQAIEKHKNISAVLLEFPRRQQIYEESVALMQKTNSPEVLYGRYIDVRDFMEWAAKLKADGYPVNINQTESQAISQLNSFYNFHCVRIANHVAENSTTSKRYGILVEMLETLKDADNYDEAVAEITPLIESAKQAKENCAKTSVIENKSKKNKKDTIRIIIKQFVEKYNVYIPDDLYFFLLELELEKQYYNLPMDIYDKILSDKAKTDKFNESLSKATSLNNKGIELEKEGKIDEAIAVYEQNIEGDCYPAHHSFDRLIVIYGSRKDYDNKRRVLKKAIEIFGKDTIDGAKEYRGKLAAMDVKEPIYPKQAKHVKVSGKTLGAQLYDIQMQVPEFDFYSIVTEPPLLPMPIREAMFDIKIKFTKMLEEAEYQEHCGRYDIAAEIYENMIADEYKFSKPYERLIVIYKKAKLDDDVVRILEKGIDFFSKLRTEQYNYVNGLAVKYGKTEFWNERYNSGKKITYYLGAFELYNPYPCVEKFKQMLEKQKSLKSNENKKQ